MKVVWLRRSAVRTAACVGIAAALALACVLVPFAVRASLSPAARFTVAIDAGHGGIDGGVVGTGSGVAEAKLNLDIAKKLAADLAACGIGTVLTRTTDAGLYGLSTENFKKRDMRARAAIIENAAPDLVVSIHQNAFPRRDERGAQVFYRKGNAEGAALAACVQKQLRNALPASDRAAKVGDFFMLNCTDAPAILVECGFLSNSEDEANLLDEAYRDRVAYTICLGILAYLGPAAPDARA